MRTSHQWVRVQQEGWRWIFLDMMRDTRGGIIIRIRDTDKHCLTEFNYAQSTVAKEAM